MKSILQSKYAVPTATTVFVRAYFQKTPLNATAERSIGMAYKFVTENWRGFMSLGILTFFNDMEQSIVWEVNSISASQRVQRIL